MLPCVAAFGNGDGVSQFSQANIWIGIAKEHLSFFFLSCFDNGNNFRGLLSEETKRKSKKKEDVWTIVSYKYSDYSFTLALVHIATVRQSPLSIMFDCVRVGDCSCIRV